MILWIPCILIAQDNLSHDIIKLREVEVYGETKNLFHVNAIQFKTYESDAVRDTLAISCARSPMLQASAKGVLRLNL
jgi:hypothetical protein